MYAVKLYKDVSNPDNIPELWPAELRLIQDESELVDNEIAMGKEEYEKYIAEHASEKEAWNESHGE